MSLESIHKEVNKIIIDKTRVSLWLDDYTDIFSDFDPRHYSQRAVSDDFIKESKKFSRGKLNGKLEINLLMPQKKRDKKIEHIIKKRLNIYFEHRYKELEEQRKKILFRGGYFIAFGLIILIINNFFIEDFYSITLFKFLYVVFDPISWFCFWEGLNLTVFDSKNDVSSIEFNKKMSKAEFKFESFDDDIY